MIGYIQGNTISLQPTCVIVDCAGLGYEVQISLGTFGDIQKDEKVSLHTYLHVRENAMVLYGFSELNEKAMFLLLIGVNGIGPNTARSILSHARPSEIEEAVLSNQVAILKKIKGIGPKTAERMILELRDKLMKGKKEPSKSSTSLTGMHNKTSEDALFALISLGLNKSVAGERIARILKEKGNDISIEELIKTALKM